MEIKISKLNLAIYIAGGSLIIFLISYIICSNNQPTRHTRGVYRAPVNYYKGTPRRSGWANFGPCYSNGRRR